MEPRYNHKAHEEKIYALWEKGGYFAPKIDKKKKPFSILLPLPNASDPLHMGHALFTVEDIMIRYHRMLGEPTLWLPGADHAGIETQFIFERELAREGKSRFDFDRETLYKMIFAFVEKNRKTNMEQLKQLGFSFDWTRYHYSLEPKIIKMVLATFRKLHQDHLIYRGERIVNFCTSCGTAFSELEVEYEEKDDLLYFLGYGTIQIATARPETIFADVAVAVNPKDKKYRKLIGKKAVIPLIERLVPIIADEAIDIKFGTGALKVTPGHDVLDFEIGQRHNLKTISVIDKNGRMVNVPEKYLGLSVLQARQEVVKDLEKEKKLIKTEPLKHTVGVCYRCGTVIEPLILPQWFTKMKTLAEPAIKAVEERRIKIFPRKPFEKMYFDWLKNIHDWNISRQNVWGPRVPAWYCLDDNESIELTFIDKNENRVSGSYKDLKKKYSFEEIKRGLQLLVAGKDATYFLTAGPCPKCRGNHVLQETNTFDTWFLSGQWPLTTLGYPNGQDFKYFYPTSVLDTLWDILFFWVARMVMFGLYLTGEVPFRVVHLHARVVDKQGRKMSKSLGNVINPIDMVEKYGADALRMSLIFGVAPASDIAVSEEKIKGMRNFTNKLWNIGRFINLNLEGKSVPWFEEKMTGLTAADKAILRDLKQLKEGVTQNLDQFRFGQAAQDIYDFVWHEFADKYVESSKKRIGEGDLVVLSVLRHIFLNCLKLLHPFMPFITEALWGKFKRLKKEPLILSSWPKA